MATAAGVKWMSETADLYLALAKEIEILRNAQAVDVPNILGRLKSLERRQKDLEDLVRLVLGIGK